MLQVPFPEASRIPSRCARSDYQLFIADSKIPGPNDMLSSIRHAQTVNEITRSLGCLDSDIYL
jgi:hypothetical protein